MKNGSSERQPTPPTEVSAKPRRRRFTAAYKLKIVQEAETCAASGKTGEVAALLRREGLYSSHLTVWRRERERGELEALAPKKRGPKAAAPDARDRRIGDLERELARVTARAERAETLVEIQKKVASLLGRPLE
jgi:transposase-like protein